ncbi:MAG: DinB family protein [Gemmatimonadota bacterium]|jgi:uncharacterized damage-inducible protein DinB
MKLDASLVEEAIEFLGFNRQGTIGEAANIPDERWDYRPHPKARSVEELVRHMIQATAMLIGEACDPDGDFQRRPPQDHVQAHAPDLADDMSPDALRQALSDSYDDATAKIRAAGPDIMGRSIRRFDGGTWARIMYVFHAGSHEDYHRGQLAMYAREMGLIPALTQRIWGDEAE